VEVLLVFSGNWIYRGTVRPFENTFICLCVFVLGSTVNTFPGCCQPSLGCIFIYVYQWRIL
jgi:hypothetical protein